jgi:acetylornithine deacetylase/succinyl-diaminopimelate desuccinylase-like protein
VLLSLLSGVSDECVAFLRRQAAELDLPIQVHELATDKPIVIITWLGEEPALPSIMLNSHMDVVPVCEVGLFLRYNPHYPTFRFIRCAVT